EKGGAPLRARAFGHVRALNRLGSLAPGLANWFNRRGLVRAALNRALGLAAERSIPAFAKSLARQWGFEGAGPPDAPEVVLFGDCFTMYNEPRIGLAARRVLEACGYRVRLVDAGCCGRAMISLGLLDDAAAAIDAALERLTSAARDPAVRAVVV